ncbi:MAG: type IV secretion system DotC family protein [Gammaproteobacteria bacterium]|nr:type IV secretion system DotC family protein [Gammaproteobacteria bacterium]
MKSVAFSLLIVVSIPLYAQGSPSLKELVELGAKGSDDAVRPWGARYGDRYAHSKYQWQDDDIDMKALGPRGPLLQEEAMRIGAAGGMAHRHQKLEKAVLTVSSALDRTFRFDSVAMKNGTVLPPVLSTAKDNLAISDNSQVLRTAGQSFHILKQARFITVIPTWRDYLLNSPSQSFKTPALLPRNKAELNAWRVWVVRGWQHGMSNADAVWRININQLRRDLVGMYLYHLLKLRGMVSEPFIKDSVQAVSGDDDNLVINDRTLAITTKPKMQHDTENWRAIESLPKLFGLGVD